MDPVADLNRPDSQTTLVADDPSNLPPTSFALYVYPDLSEAAPRKVWSNWTGGHRKRRYPSGLFLKADHFIRTNAPYNPNNSTHAASRQGLRVQEVTGELLSQIQYHFDQAFIREGKFDKKMMSCLEEATKTAMDEYIPSQADSGIFEIVSIVPYLKKTTDHQPTIDLDIPGQEGYRDVQVIFG
jgi:hypothetical protein